MNEESNVSERTHRLAKKFYTLNIKDEKGAPLVWYAWPHDESVEGIVMSITGDENVAVDAANIINLYGIVSADRKAAIFRHEPDHAHPHGFFTLCIDAADVNEATLDKLMPQKGSSPHP